MKLKHELKYALVVLIHYGIFVLFPNVVYYLLLLLVFRYKLRYMNRGVRNLRGGNFNEAINHFEKSYQYFESNSFIDKYRHLFLLSVSRYSYKESSLTNIAYCYAQLGDLEKTKIYYNKALLLNSNNLIAKAGLREILKN